MKNYHNTLDTAPCLIACKKAFEVRSPFRQFPSNTKAPALHSRPKYRKKPGFFELKEVARNRVFPQYFSYRPQSRKKTRFLDSSITNIELTALDSVLFLLP